MATVTWGPMGSQLGFSNNVLNDSYAVGVGSLAFGAVILCPFALKYGRRPVYILSMAAQTGLSVWLARIQNVADLMLTNILTCAVGGLSEVLVQMTVADIYFVHQRGNANSIYYWCVMAGTSLAPVPAGYITTSQGWRWVWWWMVILIGAGLVVFIFLYEETLFFHAIDRISQPGNPSSQTASEKEVETAAHDEELQSAFVHVDHSIPKKTYWQRLAPWTISSMPLRELAKKSYEPLALLFTFPGIVYMALEYGFLTACTTVPITTYSIYMIDPPYNYGADEIGLIGIAMFVGSSIGAIIYGPLSDYWALYLSRRNGGVFEPEMRLWLPLAFCPLIPAGLFMFGIGLNNGSSWILVAFGLAISSIGVVTASASALTYLTDAYTDVRGAYM